MLMDSLSGAERIIVIISKSSFSVETSSTPSCSEINIAMAKMTIHKVKTQISKWEKIFETSLTED